MRGKKKAARKPLYTSARIAYLLDGEELEGVPLLSIPEEPEAPPVPDEPEVPPMLDEPEVPPPMCDGSEAPEEAPDSEEGCAFLDFFFLDFFLAGFCSVPVLSVPAVEPEVAAGFSVLVPELEPGIALLPLEVPLAPEASPPEAPELLVPDAPEVSLLPEDGVLGMAAEEEPELPALLPG